MVLLARALRLAGRPLSRRDPPAPADAIVVLGAPVRDDGSLGPVLRERVDVGVALWRDGVAPVLCVSGGGPSGRVEAEAMAARCRALGVSADALVVEAASRTTEENARLCAALLLPAGHTRVWIVSQPFHLRRAVDEFSRAGFDPRGWHIDDSVQYRRPRVAARWIVREYAAWVYTLGRRGRLLPHIAPPDYRRKK